MIDPRREERKMGWGTRLVLIAFALGAAAMLFLIGLSLLIPRVVDRAVEAYTDIEPALLPAPEVSKEDTDAIQARVDAFDKALDTHEAREPLVLSERDLNALLAKSLKDERDAAIGLQLLPGQVRARLSLRLTQKLPLGPWSRDLTGRYLNGIATFDAAVRDHTLDLRLAGFEVKGRPLPGYVLDILRGEIARSGVLEGEDVKKFLNKVDSVELQSGQVTITPPRPRDRPESR